MKIIPNQKITAVSSDSEDANYPDDNVLDENPKRIWKANSTYTATLTFSMSPGTSGMMIANTNALSLTVTVEDPNSVEWFTSDADWFASDAAWASQNAVLSNELYNLDGTSGAAWVEWPYSSISLEATVLFTASSEATVYAGVAVADKVYEYDCPQLGITEGIKSYSIVKELQNGAMYRKERDKVRMFTFNFIEDRSTDFYEFMYDIAKEIGYKPAGWRLADIAADGFNWVVYARFQQMPSGTHSMPDHSRIQTSLIEVL